ncbi:MAG: VCBS repeat-containing protein [Desulfamplus sp.]|nr:VCBS repeat-containing protein [Desulfamplus sp.]
MKIMSSNISFVSERQYEERRFSRRTVEALDEGKSPDASARVSSSAKEVSSPGKNDPVAVYFPVKNRQPLFSKVTNMDAPDPEEQINGDPKLAAMKRMIESMIGKKIKLTDMSGFHAGGATGGTSGDTLPGLTLKGLFRHPPDSSLFSVKSPFTVRSMNEGQLDISSNLDISSKFVPDIPVQRVRITDINSLYESEKTTFGAMGVVKTSSGEDISFGIGLEMSREFYREEKFQMTADAVLVDPLVVNFGGTPADLTDIRFKFDLDSDGEEESIPWLKSGSGFLVLDRNGDGKVNNGGELFGPATGRGFRELAELDDDGNGWIDENDGAYENLLVWSGSSPATAELKSLGEMGIGAISLASAETPFTIKEGVNNETLGQVRRTGIYLKEDGGAGTVQQLDLSV